MTTEDPTLLAIGAAAEKLAVAQAQADSAKRDLDALIVQAGKEGATLRAIAAHAGVSYETVRRIRESSR